MSTLLKIEQRLQAADATEELAALDSLNAKELYILAQREANDPVHEVSSFAQEGRP